MNVVCFFYSEFYTKYTQSIYTNVTKYRKQMKK